MRERMKKKKNIIIGGLLAVVFLMSVGYAAFASNLSITGTANTSSWIIKITNIREKTKTAGVTNKGTSYTDLTANFNCELTLPGDSITYEVTVENQGNIDASLKEVTKSFTNNKYIDVTYSGLYEGQMLYKQGAENSTAVMEVTVTFKDKDYEGTFTDTITSNINIVLDFVQEGNNIDTTKKYLIQYDMGGGEPLESKYVAWEEKGLQSGPAKRLGYKLERWYTIVDGIYKEITLDSSLSNIVEDPNIDGLIINAGWNGKLYTLIYDSQGGTSVREHMYYWSDGNVIASGNETTKRGYTLDTWYSEPNGQGFKITSDMKVSDIIKKVYGPGIDELPNASGTYSGTITIYANWIENSYTLAYNSRGGSEISSQTYKWTAPITLPDPPTKEGYTFDCWRTNTPNARTGAPRGILVNDGMSLSEFASNSDPSTPKTIYAYWTQNS